MQTIGEKHGKLWSLYKHVCQRTLRYKEVFRGVGGETVLRDLATFCHANSPCTNDRENGRRDVWLRIQKHLQLNEDELTILFAKVGPEQRHQLWYPSNTFLEE